MDTDTKDLVCIAVFLLAWLAVIIFIGVPVLFWVMRHIVLPFWGLA